MAEQSIASESYDNIRAGIVEPLKTARSAAALNVNSIMTAAYWEIGRRIVTLEQRGEYRYCNQKYSETDLEDVFWNLWMILLLLGDNAGSV